MNVKFYLLPKKDVSRIALRMYYNKLDLSISLDLFVQEKDWSQESQQVSNSIITNQKLSELKSEVLRQYNEDYVLGVDINKNWLKDVVSNVFNRQNKQVGLVSKDCNAYLVDFGRNWLEKFSQTWKTSHKEIMGSVLKSQYAKTINLLDEYQRKRKVRLSLKDFTKNDIYDFVDYLQELEYNSSTIQRNVSRISFFCNRAEEQGLKVSTAYKQRIYIEQEEDFEGIFLSQSEIQKIINYDFSFDESLEVTRDNFVIGIYSGLRSSDFISNLDISDFRNGFIKIKTQKTKTNVVIPVHNEVAKVLKKYFHNLPPKQTKEEFNKKIKILCQVVGIDELIEGKLFDKEKKRKVKGYYKKYELISSHCIRRSFCSNLRGKISDESLQKILGWSSNKMLEVYDKNSKEKYAKELEQIWR